jgi:hypothetical protein
VQILAQCSSDQAIGRAEQGLADGRREFHGEIGALLYRNTSCRRLSCGKDVVLGESGPAALREACLAFEILKVRWDLFAIYQFGTLQTQKCNREPGYG